LPPPRQRWSQRIAEHRQAAGAIAEALARDGGVGPLSDLSDSTYPQLLHHNVECRRAPPDESVWFIITDREHDNEPSGVGG
jgi:hypothetical protein